VKRGEVWLAALDPVRGSEQAGTRPVLIVQGDALNHYLRTALVVPLTSNLRWSRFPFCVLITQGEGGLRSDSVALCHQTRVLDSARLIERWGEVDAPTVARVEQALRVAMDIAP
jgi:mRNA interferase MazF